MANRIQTPRRQRDKYMLTYVWHFNLSKLSIIKPVNHKFFFSIPETPIGHIRHCPLSTSRSLPPVSICLLIFISLDLLGTSSHSIPHPYNTTGRLIMITHCYQLYTANLIPRTTKHWSSHSTLTCEYHLNCIITIWPPTPHGKRSTTERSRLADIQTTTGTRTKNEQRGTPNGSFSTSPQRQQQWAQQQSALPWQGRTPIQRNIEQKPTNTAAPFCTP